MEDWNAQKMLDLYIHDYLVKNNKHTTANILAEEAGFEPKIVAEGFLVDWWSLFWDTYTSRLPNNPQAQGAQGSSSSYQAPENDRSVPQNVPHGPPVPEPNVRTNFRAKPNVFNFEQVAKMLQMVDDESGKPMDEDGAALSSSGDDSDSMDITYKQLSVRKQEQQ